MLRQPFPPFDQAVVGRRDDRVDDDAGLGVVAAVEHGHEHAQALVHLRRRQADAVVLVHRLDHVVDELLEARIPDLGTLDGAGGPPQHRVSHAGDLEDGHRPTTADSPSACPPHPTLLIDSRAFARTPAQRRQVMTVAGRSVVGSVVVALLVTAHTAHAQVYPAAKTGGNYMHNYYLPPAASSTPWWPSWAPDGKRIAFAMDGSIWTIDVGGNVARELVYSAREYPVVARVLARRPVARLHRRRRRQEHQPARAQPGDRRLHRPDDRHAREPRAGVVARRQAARLRVDGAQRLLQRLRDGGDRRQARRDHPGHDRQRLRPRAPLLQPDRRATSRRPGRPTARSCCWSRTAASRSARAASGGCRSAPTSWARLPPS